MTRSRTLTLLLSAAMLLLSQLACVEFDKAKCELRGGEYIPTYRNPSTGFIEQDAYCDENPITDENADQGSEIEGEAEPQEDVDLPLAECLVPDQAESWNYENLKGETGKFCNADFVYQNSSDQRISLIVQETWDSNTQSGTEWNSLILDPGQEW